MTHQVIATEERVVRLLLEADNLRQQVVKLRAQLKDARSKWTTDPLTGLPNRRAWNEAGKPRIQRAKRDARAMVMMIIDINEFKKVNDRFRHAAGDKLLMAVARVIQSSLRPEDLCARWGGDEFVALISNAGTLKVPAIDVANRVAMRVWEAVSRINIGCAGLKPSVSIGGVVLRPSGRMGLGSVLELADARLYEAKKMKGQADSSGQPMPTVVMEEIKND